MYLDEEKMLMYVRRSGADGLRGKIMSLVTMTGVNETLEKCLFKTGYREIDEKKFHLEIQKELLRREPKSEVPAAKGRKPRGGGKPKKAE